MEEDDFNGRLMGGERIIWSGQPAGGILFTAQDAFLIPFSLLWCGFAIFWEFSIASAPGAPVFMLLWGAMFIIIGLNFVAGRFVFDAWIRQRTSYAVTTRRILILRRGMFSKFTAMAINRLPTLVLDERASGRGNILFQEAGPIWGNRGFGGWAPSLNGSRFLAIADARDVFAKIQKLSGNVS